MTRSPLFYTGAVLAAGNTILSLVLWRTLTVDPPPRGSTLPALAISATTNSAASAFKRIGRQSDPATARLFGLPPAEVLMLTEPVQTPASEEPALRLIGVILVEAADSERIALVEYGLPARIARLHMGAQLHPSGWRVERISSSSVDMIRREERRTLKLD